MGCLFSETLCIKKILAGKSATAIPRHQTVTNIFIHKFMILILLTNLSQFCLFILLNSIALFDAVLSLHFMSITSDSNAKKELLFVTNLNFNMKELTETNMANLSRKRSKKVEIAFIASLRFLGWSGRKE